ncbi:nuclear transport factor 2 family protein [Paraburkholderia diazotrophica]|uniref:nuclear transport factor 2 family protein n=1 Tax=Paraburkholderia diazotrophica TaxID=667676 RepID=UPI003176DF25
MAVIQGSAFAKTETCHATSKKQIAALFDRWNDSLKTGNPDKVVANYAPHSILLPTVSNKPRVTTEEKVDYFRHFLENKPVGTIDFREIMIECNTAIDAGLYSFKFGDGSVVKARYTFTYEWNGNKWLITTHHSSKMPEGD